MSLEVTGSIHQKQIKSTFFNKKKDCLTLISYESKKSRQTSLKINVCEHCKTELKMNNECRIIWQNLKFRTNIFSIFKLIDTDVTMILHCNWLAVLVM